MPDTVLVQEYTAGILKLTILVELTVMREIQKHPKTKTNRQLQAYLVLFWFALLHFADTVGFYKMKDCGHPGSSQVSWRHFSKSICSLCVSVSHFNNSQNISDFFIITTISLLWWSMFFDVAIIIVLGCHEPRSYKMINLITYCWVCSDRSTNWLFPHLSLSLRHMNMETRSINNCNVL